MVLGFDVVREVFEDVAADANEIACRKSSFIDRFVVDVRAVGAAEVDDDEAVGTKLEIGVLPTHRLVFTETEVAFVRASDEKAVIGKINEAFAEHGGVNLDETRLGRFEADSLWNADSGIGDVRLRPNDLFRRNVYSRQRVAV